MKKLNLFLLFLLVIAALTVIPAVAEDKAAQPPFFTGDWISDPSLHMGGGIFTITPEKMFYRSRPGKVTYYRVMSVKDNFATLIVKRPSESKERQWDYGFIRLEARAVFKPADKLVIYGCSTYDASYEPLYNYAQEELARYDYLSGPCDETTSKTMSEQTSGNRITYKEIFVRPEPADYDKKQ